MMFELGLVCPESCVQDISDALEALDALSVSVEDADAQSDAEQALFGEPGMPPPKEAWQWPWPTSTSSLPSSAMRLRRQ